MIEEKRAEAVAIAEKEAETIKANAEHEAELLLEEKVKGIQSELKGTVQQLYTEFLSQLESLKQQVTASEADFEQTLSQLMKQTTTTTMTEEDNITPDRDSGVSLEVSPGIPAEVPEQIQAMGQSGHQRTGDRGASIHREPGDDWLRGRGGIGNLAPDRHNENDENRNPP